MLAPALFTLFINEFGEIIENSGIQGVQLFPNIALISATISWLQKQLNLLFDYNMESKLVVNF